MKILLLNPPGKRTYLRDYYCSKISQADYLNHPIDLLFQSAWLHPLGELSIGTCLAQIEEIQPSVVVGLIGSVSYSEDLEFYQLLKKRVRCELVLSGDVLSEARTRRMEELDFADALLHDFSSSDVSAWILGEEPSRLTHLTLRHQDGPGKNPIPRERGRLESFPVPRQDLFVGKKYRYPFVRESRFATVLTDFGCPYPCNFCIMSTLGWKLRPLASVLRELDQLAALKVPELLILDQTFGIDKKRAARLLEAMLRREYRFGWVCFSRPDVVDSVLLSQMRRAGCHSVILGLESGSEQVLAAAQKGYGEAQIRSGFALCRDHGLRTVATIILGLPEETRESFETTLALLRELEPDYVSINVAVPRMGTPLRQRAAKLGLMQESLSIMDQSGQSIAMPTLTLTRNEVEALRKRAVRELYLNFSALTKRSLKLARHGSRQELMIHLQQGAALLRNQWGRHG